MSGSRVSTGLLMGFGLLAPPLAWTLQHVAGFALTQASCGRAGRGWDVHLDTWTVAVSAAALIVALAAAGAAAIAFRRTRDAGEAPPTSRVHFLSIVALTTTPLFVAIILMSSIGAVVLSPCSQG